MKKCNLDCYVQHEGFCALKEIYGLEPKICKAKTDADLITEEEFEEGVGT